MKSDIARPTRKVVSFADLMLEKEPEKTYPDDCFIKLGWACPIDADSTFDGIADELFINIPIKSE